MCCSTNYTLNALCVQCIDVDGTRCRDGVNVLWCRSHLVWLVFEGSIPTCACFHSENVFVTCSCCLFVFLIVFRMVREKRGGKGRQGEDAWSVKYESIELCCSQRTNNHHSEIVNLSTGFRGPSKAS